MEIRAAVAHAAGKPLTIETVTLDGPKEGEVLVEGKINLVNTGSSVSPKDDSKSTASSKGDDAKKLVSGL